MWLDFREKSMLPNDRMGDSGNCQSQNKYFGRGKRDGMGESLVDVVHDFDLFVAGEIGSFKGISIDPLHKDKKPIMKNIRSNKELTKENNITAVAWGDPDENYILVGSAGRKVKIYDTILKSFKGEKDISSGEGSIKGISRYNEALIAAVESGDITIWTGSENNIVKTGNHIERMRHSPVDHNIIATGGKENDLKLWNLEKNKSTFTAKNVRHDMLELRVPVWVTDMDFVADSTKVATCSRYGHVRLYDPNAQRRPVVNFEEKDEVFTTITATPREHQFVVGTGKGKMMLVDLRNKGKIVQHYKGAAGSVRAIACHKTKPYVLSVSMDRHLLVHDINSKALLNKVYLVSRPNCLLLRSDAFSKEDSREDKGVTDAEGKNEEVAEDDYDELFDNMETVEEPPIKKKKKCKSALG